MRDFWGRKRGLPGLRPPGLRPARLKPCDRHADHDDAASAACGVLAPRFAPARRLARRPSGAPAVHARRLQAEGALVRCRRRGGERARADREGRRGEQGGGLHEGRARPAAVRLLEHGGADPQGRGHELQGLQRARRPRPARGHQVVLELADDPAGVHRRRVHRRLRHDDGDVRAGKISAQFGASAQFSAQFSDAPPAPPRRYKSGELRTMLQEAGAVAKE